MPQAFKEAGYFVTGARDSKCTLSYCCTILLLQCSSLHFWRLLLLLLPVRSPPPRLDVLDVLLVDLDIRAGVGKSFHPNKPPNFDRELAPACTALRPQEFFFCLFVSAISDMKQS